MNEALQRIEHCAPPPQLAKRLFERLEQEARANNDTKVALNALLRRFSSRNDLDQPLI